MTFKKLCLHVVHTAFLSAYLISNQAALADAPIDFGLQVTNTYDNADDTPATPATTDHYYTLRREDVTLLKYTPEATSDDPEADTGFEEVADLSQIFSSVKSVKTGVFDAGKTIFISGIASNGGGNKLIKFQLGQTSADTQSNANTQREEFILADTSVELANEGHSDFRDIALDAEGNVYIADVARHRIIRVDQFGRQNATEGVDYTVVAGNGIEGFSGDNGKASTAQLNSPESIAIDRFANLIIADTGNHRIRAIIAEANGLIDVAKATIKTISGGGETGANGTELDGSEDAGSPVSLGVDFNNDLHYFDRDNKRWVRISNNADGESSGNLDYTKRQFGTLDASNKLLDVQSGVYEGAIVPDWQQNKLAFLVDNIAGIEPLIYSGVSIDKETGGIDFDKSSQGNPYFDAGPIEIKKDGSRYELDFIPKDMSVGARQVLFQITAGEGGNYDLNKQITVVLYRESVEKSRLEFRTSGFNRKGGDYEAYVDKDGNLIKTEHTGGEYYNSSFQISIGSVDLADSVDYDAMNNLVLSITTRDDRTLAQKASPSTFYSYEKMYTDYDVELNDSEFTTFSFLRHSNFPFYGSNSTTPVPWYNQGQQGIPNSYKHYQVPDTCYAETWEWQRVSDYGADLEVKPTKLLAKHPFKCFKDKPEITPVALKAEYCDLAGDLTQPDSNEDYLYHGANSNTRLGKYLNNKYPGYRDASHCFKDENNELYADWLPYHSSDNVGFRAVKAHRLTHSTWSSVPDVFADPTNGHMLTPGSTIKLIHYPINYYIPELAGDTNGIDNLHNAWPGSMPVSHSSRDVRLGSQESGWYLGDWNGSYHDGDFVRRYEPSAYVSSDSTGLKCTLPREIDKDTNWYYFEGAFCDVRGSFNVYPGNVHYFADSHYVENNNNNYPSKDKILFQSNNVADGPSYNQNENRLLEALEILSPTDIGRVRLEESSFGNQSGKSRLHSTVYLALDSGRAHHIPAKSVAPFLDPVDVDQEPVYADYEPFFARSIYQTVTDARPFYYGMSEYLTRRYTDPVAMNYGATFKGNLRIGGANREVVKLPGHNSHYAIFSALAVTTVKDFQGIITNFKVSSDGVVKYEHETNVDLTSLANGSISAGKQTLTIQGKNSSSSLYKIVGSNSQPKIYEINGASYNVKVPKYIAIDTNGKIYYNKIEAETAERDSSDVVLKEVHTLSKIYPPLNNTVPIDRTTIDAEFTGDYYELSANITDSNHKMFVEYVAQYLASVSTIRPLSSTSQDAQIVFSDAYAGLPIDMMGCPVARKDASSFNSRKADEIEKYLSEQKTAGKSAFTFAEAMGDVEFEIGTVFCRNTEWVSSDQVFDPEVQGIVYNPADDAGKRYRLVRVHASGAFGGVSKTFGLTDDYSNFVNQAKTMDGATDITYIWAEQYRVTVNTTKSKAGPLPKIYTYDDDGAFVLAYSGKGEFWVDKGTQIELLVPVESAELTLEGYTFREQGQDDQVFDLVNNNGDELTIDGVQYYNINVGGSQGIKSAANVTWDYGNKVYKYQVKIGEAFIPDVTATSDGVAIPAKAIQAIQDTIHDPAFFVPLNAQTYIDQETGLAKPAPKSPALTGQNNAYVWQNRDPEESSDFKGAMYFTRPGVYQMEWLLGGIDYPVEGTEGLQKLIAEVVVTWPDESGYIPHIGGTPDVPLEVSTSDGVKFKVLNYSETDSLKVDVDTLSYPEWFGDTTKTYRSVLVFTQSKDDRPAQGNVDDEEVIVKVVKSRHWTNSLEDNVSVNIGAEIVSPLHDDDVGHNGYLLPLFGDGDVDQAMYNAATYDRETRFGELFAVNREADPTDSDDDIVVVWYKRLGDTSDPNDGEPLIESKWPAWPHQAVRYIPQWPQGDRIVIAGRQGSDGKKTSGAESRQLKFAPALYSNLTLYNQTDKDLPGYNPNEEHALITKSWRYRTETPVPDAAFALRNDLNNTDRSADNYTSEPYVLVQYRDRANNKYGMNAYYVDTESADTYDFDPGDDGRGFNYTFNYDMEVGQTVIAPYPLNNVIGANKLREIWGENVTDENGNITQQTYWEDRNGTAWAISGGGDAKLFSYFWYPVQAGFWHPTAVVGDVVPFGYAGSIVSNGELNLSVSKASTHQIAYNVSWPESTPELRIGETLTFAGGEHKTDNPGIEGLPGAIGWASGEIVFDSRNPTADVTKTAVSTGFSARLSPVLREIKVNLPLSEFPDDMKPATKRTEVKGGVWYFSELHAGIKQRIYYDNLAGNLVLRGFVNDKTVGDETLQAAPPADFILQSNALTNDDFHSVTALSGANVAFKTAITRLYALSQQPTISGYELYGRQAAPEVLPLAYSASYTPEYHLGLSRFLRGSDNRLLTVRGTSDIARRMQNGQLPAGLALADVDLIDPASQYDSYVEQVDSTDSTISAAKTVFETGKASAKVASEAYEAAKKVWEGKKRSYYEPCKVPGDTYENPNQGYSNQIDCVQRHFDATQAKADLAVAKQAHEDAQGISQTAEKALSDSESARYSNIQSLGTLLNPEASELPYGFTVEDLNTINALKSGEKLVRIVKDKGHIPASLLGSGLALMTNPNLLDAAESFGGGYVVVAENNDPALDGNPVSLHIVKINNKPLRGMIKTVFSENVFDEKITLRHTGDFGGNPEDLIFDWRYVETAVANSDLRLSKGYKAPTLDADPSCPIPRSVPDSSGRWKPFVDERPGNKKGLGRNELTFGNTTGKDVLVDNSFFVRYTHKNNCVLDSNGNRVCSNWTGWTGAANGYPCDVTPEYQPQLVMGWVKRVTENVNQYDARINDFSTDGSPATYVSMIQQAGQMHEGDVALNPDKDVIENLGLIELYQTVLNRAKGLSIDADQTSVGVTQALQNAASRISQFYSLLGNEAYSDALDPTIGFASNSREYGTLAPTVFTFQNQLSSLGEEELALLRGRPEKGARPAYNRLLWNFTNGDGEAAYALSYNIQDLDKNGEINEADGRGMYPQGHGDAWGHYLSGLTTFYDLLRHPIFTWESRSESYQIEGVTLDVDYLDERRFAEAAAYKAKAGAEVVTQTYRERYVEDVDGQWQGYKDTDGSRAWGVDGWARRAHQGAYYDWVTAAALIPAKSQKTGIQKIDRTTVGELQEISAHGIKVLTELAQVDNGLNPLGLLPDVVPFDIAPGTGQTHFEQVVERAESAIENATNVFDYANELKHRVRKVADTQQEFTEQVDQQDREYRNRLIEVFGTPYAGTIGAGKAYAEGYQGPDYKFYQYIDVAEISDKTLPVQDETVVAFVNELGARTVQGPTDAIDDGEKILMEFKDYYTSDFPASFTRDLDFPQAPKVTLYPLSGGSYAFTAPSSWEQRKIPGDLQSASIDMVKLDVEVRLAEKDYSSLIDDLWRLEREIKARSNLREITLEAKAETSKKNTILSLASLATTLGIAGVDHFKDKKRRAFDAAIEWWPRVSGMSNDLTSATRAAIKTKGVIMGLPLTAAGLALTSTKGVLDSQITSNLAVLKEDIEKFRYDYEIQAELSKVDELLASEPIRRMRLFGARESLRQSLEKYRSILGKGLALLDERDAFHKKVAFKTHGKRYQDMAFRINRTEASQKYRASFELAAKYVYLAAKAYDYDTNLSTTHPASATPLLSEVVRARSLGQFFNGEPVVGMGGLADVLARLKTNYSVLKTQMGINNPQLETMTVSLRKELFRINDGEDDATQDDSDARWKTELLRSWIEDIWTDLPEYRTHMRPFTTEAAGAHSALVIPFSTNVISGQNLFGRPLGSADHAFDASHFATRIHSVGVSVAGYNDLELAETLRAYLVPVGQDVMYVPDSDTLQTREWDVQDQKIPAPLLTGRSDIENPDWLPLSGLDGSSGELRRHSRLRVYDESSGEAQLNGDTRLFGRSVWNNRWLLVIPRESLGPDGSFRTFIYGKRVPGSSVRDGQGISDIKLTFKTYAYSGE